MRYLVLGDNNGLGLTVIKEIELRGYEEIDYLSDDEIKEYSPKNLEAYIEKKHPDVVIDLYEDNNMERAETSDYTELDCYKTNVLMTKSIAEASERIGAKLIYLSTDQVYAGKKKDFNKETDNTDSLSVYGATKITAEKEVMKNPKHFIVRPGMIYGGRHDIIDDLLWTRDPVMKGSLEVVSPVDINFLASTMADMSYYDNYGIYNVADSGRCTIKEFLESVRNVYRRNIQIVPADHIDYYVSPNRALNVDKLKENGYQKPSFWITSLAAFRKTNTPGYEKVLKKQ